MKKKIGIGILLIITLLAIISYILRDSLWEKAGRFMAPQGDYTADVVILEGADYIRTGFIQTGMDLLKAGKVKKIIVVVHRIAPAHRPFGINGDYPDVVRQKLKDTGLKEEQFKVIVSPIRHPVTLKEAQFVLKELAADKLSSAILVAPSFHTRRSYMAYSHAGQAQQIKIYPLASFTEHHPDKWWTDQGAWRDFGTESLKLMYYLAGGHLPFKFSY
jgi:uncharacterized SAM-binding protein YcdF (DUF218 family)